MNSKTGWARALLVLAVGAICLAFAMNMNAQVQSTTTTSKGTPTTEVQVTRATVVMVEGNDLIVKKEDGSLVHLPNVPESARATVDGKQLGIHDLKPGMTLERTITTTTTPKTITTVQTVTGTVWHVSPPGSVILRMDNNTNQQFKVPKGQKFSVNGAETDIWGLKKGMTVSATKIVEVPETEIAHQQQVTGSMPPPPPAPPADAPILVAVAEPVPTPAAEPAELPKTGSSLPLIGMLGGLFLLSSFGLGVLRKSS